MWTLNILEPKDQGKDLQYQGRGGGLVVSVLAFYSDNPSSNPASYLIFLYEKTKINKKVAGVGTEAVPKPMFAEFFLNLWPSNILSQDKDLQHLG